MNKDRLMSDEAAGQARASMSEQGIRVPPPGAVVVERPTARLRWFRGRDAYGWPRDPVLQQLWQTVWQEDRGQVTCVREEWRDVPEEKEEPSA